MVPRSDSNRQALRRRILSPVAQTDCTGHLREGPLRHRVPDARTALGHEEGFDGPMRKDAIAGARVVHERLTRGVVQRDEARLAELRLAYSQNAADEVHIGLVQAKRFPEPQAAGRQQPEERGEGQSARPRCRWQSGGLGNKPADLLVAVDVRRLAPAAMRQEPAGRDLRARIGEAAPLCEPAHHAKSLGPRRGLRAR